ncbi:P-loop containing nucleoside triphosphate hydrolase protein [Thamnocephalis sphaerospora]|uniref:P-loop containing nucleoside triphosphate hydrolase protein n=1 Tax=Thamnocephalis sphaerospora TaxID=78915 RepID=A0A4P9XJG5_9FUNG|nr:P-loop containing nucleoside triphosphate hydrolase protein [Thamnocephalis sphaerospora]|eukprot:RKP05895.1 P-loop containing nucleoside triphosphate hydrolase protein [Thamnocephalis sphaerospora]
MSGISHAEVDGLVRECVPGVDDAIVEYILGYLDETPTVEEEEDLAAFLGPILEDAGGTQDAVDELCARLTRLFPGRNTGGKPQLEKLKQPVQMIRQDAVSATAKLAVGATDMERVAGRKVASQVDSKKLEKAEAKIKAKMEKRERRVAYQASKLIDKKEDPTFIAVNPILDYTSTKGKSKDVRVENFDISFAGKRILTDANLTLAYGRRYGLIGRNGVGKCKSTLLRNISVREIAVPAHVSILHVEQEMTGTDTPAIQAVLSADAWREHLLEEERTLQAKLQELDETATAAEAGDAEKEQLEKERTRLSARLQTVFQKLEDIESDKAESRASAILAGLGFQSEAQQRATKTFSGGWRMRLALARALFCKPDLLLLDEPTNMLDIPAVAWLENYLQSWPSTLLVVSHDREFLDEVATDIMHQHSERLDYYRGNFSQFYKTRAERRKNQVREYEAQVQYRKHLQDFIDRWRYNANRAAQAQSKIKILEKLPTLELPEDEAVVTFRFQEPDPLSPPILQMSNVTFGYDDRVILRNVTFDMLMNSRISIVGPNGAGKTTLLKLLTGQLEPRSGDVRRNGRLRFAYFSQHHVDQLEMNMSPVSYMASRWPGKNEEEYRRHLGAFGISGMTGLQLISTLSGGQKSRVAFACLAIQKPHFLILDEPTNHLDMDSIDALTEALKSFEGGVVLVSHDERFLEAVSTEIWVCSGGVVSRFEGDSIKEYKKKVITEMA